MCVISVSLGLLELVMGRLQKTNNGQKTVLLFLHVHVHGEFGIKIKCITLYKHSNRDDFLHVLICAFVLHVMRCVW